MVLVKSGQLLFSIIVMLAAYATCAQSAEIKVVPDALEGVSLITIRGPLETGDSKAFRDVALSIDRAIVSLDSGGGDVKASIEIGKAVRLKGFSTIVEAADCFSGCALVWLAGEQRFIGDSAQIGFHGAFVDRDGVQEASRVGNALIGAYATSLGLSDRVVAFITSAAPDDVKILTPEIAKSIGLEIVDLSSGDGIPEAISEFNEAVELMKTGQDGAERAARLYWQAAKVGFAGALNNLGDAYEEGRGVPSNSGFAIYWYARAAERGEPTAYLSLATILSDGEPDRIQLVEALKFAILAVGKLPGENNRRRAQIAKEALVKRITAADVKLATELAAKWKPLFQEKNVMGDP